MTKYEPIVISEDLTLKVTEHDYGIYFENLNDEFFTCRFRGFYFPNEKLLRVHNIIKPSQIKSPITKLTLSKILNMGFETNSIKFMSVKEQKTLKDLVEYEENSNFLMKTSYEFKSPFLRTLQGLGFSQIFIGKRTCRYGRKELERFSYLDGRRVP